MGLVSLAENKYKEAEECVPQDAAVESRQSARPDGPGGNGDGAEPAGRGAAVAAHGIREESRTTWICGSRSAISRCAPGKYDEALQAFNQTLNSLDKNSKQRGDIFLRIGETYRRKGDDAGRGERAAEGARSAAGQRDGAEHAGADARSRGPLERGEAGVRSHVETGRQQRHGAQQSGVPDWRRTTAIWTTR